MKRISWLDIARGIGIVLVVLGHVMTTPIRYSNAYAMTIYNTVYYFHMPLLLFVSGVAFESCADRYMKTDTPKYIGKKITKLIIPYLSYSFLVYLIFTFVNVFPYTTKYLQNTEYGFISFGDWIVGLVSGKNIYCIHLWYIYSLFLLSILSFLLLKITKHYYKYIVLIIALLLYLFKSQIHNSGIDIFWKTAYFAIWFSFGLFYKADASIKKDAVWGSVGFILCIIFKYLLKYEITLYGWVKWTYNIVTIFTIIEVVILISKVLSFAKDKIFSYLGRNSFPIYLFHQPFCGSGIGLVLFGMLHLNVYVVMFVSFTLCFAFPLLVNRILSNRHFSVLRRIFLG